MYIHISLIFRKIGKFNRNKFRLQARIGNCPVGIEFHPDNNVILTNRRNLKPGYFLSESLTH